MLPVTEDFIETCYDCGRKTTAPEQYLACLWKSTADGSEHWGPVDVCPACARQRERQRRARLFIACMLIALLSAVISFRFLL